MVSVIMPVFNSEKYLDAAIQSVLNQTYSDFEFIILNDASTDRSAVIITRYNDSRIRYYEFTENAGYVFRLNEGIKLSKGKFIARMDSDDICTPDRIKKQVDFLLQNNNVGLCGTYYWLMTSNDKVLTTIRKYSSNNLIRFKLLFSNPICHPSVVIKREVFEKIGLYNESKKPAEDYDLWTRVIDQYDIKNIPEPLFFYRVHLNSISHLYGVEQKQKAFDSGLQYFRGQLKIDISPKNYDFFLLRDYLHNYSVSDCEKLRDALDRIHILIKNNTFEIWERKLINEELSLYYLFLWSKGITKSSNLFKGLSLFFKSNLIDNKSICFGEASQILLSTGRLSKSIFFAVIALIKNPFSKSNYYQVLNPIKAIF